MGQLEMLFSCGNGVWRDEILGLLRFHVTLQSFLGCPWNQITWSWCRCQRLQRMDCMTSAQSLQLRACAFTFILWYRIERYCHVKRGLLIPQLGETPGRFPGSHLKWLFPSRDGQESLAGPLALKFQPAVGLAEALKIRARAPMERPKGSAALLQEAAKLLYSERANLSTSLPEEIIRDHVLSSSALWSRSA